MATSTDRNILVYGYYTADKGNLGDELFKEAFQKLFPDYNLIFTDHINSKHLENISTVFLGGGSFLFGQPNIADDALTILKTKKLFYIGVGAETDIHPIHQHLISIAKLVAIRSSKGLDKISSLNSHAIVISDIVNALPKPWSGVRMKRNSILIMPNITVVPSYNDPQWKHIAWEHFKFEFAQFLEYLLDKGYTFDFFAMCDSNKLNDRNAAVEIINQMIRRNDYEVSLTTRDYSSLTELMNQYDIVITQRYHGIVLAEICKLPYIAIWHHDKLKNHNPKHGDYISMYECSKSKLIESFNDTISSNRYIDIPIDLHSFEELVQKVIHGMHGG